MIEFIIYLVVTLFGAFIATPFFSSRAHWFFKRKNCSYDSDRQLIIILGVFISIFWPVGGPFFIIGLLAHGITLLFQWITKRFKNKVKNGLLFLLKILENIFLFLEKKMAPKRKSEIKENVSYRENAKIS